MQDRVSPIMEQLSFFHDHTMLILIIITVLTLYALATCVSNFMYNKFMLEGQELETI
jgi:cytochrome c oxidase subunit 2